MKGVAAGICVLVLVGGAIAGAHERPGTTELVSMNSLGEFATNADLLGFKSESPAISADGRFVAFESSAQISPDMDVVDLDIAVSTNVYVRDRLKGITELVSADEHLGLPVGLSHDPSISANGRFVAFWSESPLLVDNDSNLTEADVFVRDLKTNKTTMVSVSDSGAAADGGLGSVAQPTPLSSEPEISPDGHFVVFASRARNLVSAELVGSHIFIRDLRSRTTELVSVDSDERPAAKTLDMPGTSNLRSNGPSVSRGGRFVVFSTSADTLGGRVGPDPALVEGKVYVRDREEGTTTLVSTATKELQAPGLPGDHSAVGPGRSISADGRFILFDSNRDDLFPADMINPFHSPDVFVKDMKTGRLENVSVSSTGGVAEAPSMSYEFSLDGRIVAFETQHSGWSNEPDWEDLGADVFVHDVAMGATEWINRPYDPSVTPKPVSDGGSEVFEPDSGYDQAVSADGRFIAFVDIDNNFVVKGDDNNAFDVFVRDRGIPLGSAVSGGGTALRVCGGTSACAPLDQLVSARDSVGDAPWTLSRQGTDLWGASLAYRPNHFDVFAAIELEYMPSLVPGPSPFVYGLSFGVGSQRYEVRSTSLLGGTFELFDCASGCTKVRDLRGGYGTTGMRIVFSLPLDALGLENGGELSNVEAYSALGSSLTGATKILDTVRLR